MKEARLKRLIEKYQQRAKENYEYTPIGEVISDLQSIQTQRIR